jgi:hypothetical protein
MLQPVFTDFAPHHADLFGRHTVNLGHRYDAADDLFGDAALASLIERTPAQATHVNTMDVTTHDPNTRREGTLEGLSGAEALAAVRNGTSGSFCNSRTGSTAATARSCARSTLSLPCGSRASSRSITRCRF